MNGHRVLTLIPASILVVAVLAGCGPRPPDAPSSSTAPAPARTLLYYRNPMGLADTSPVPKKDAMGMDYVPVYADEAPVAGQVRIPAERLQKLSVRIVPVDRRTIQRVLHLGGALQADERRQWTVSPRFEGWIESLEVATTGAPVRRGAVLATVYAPDLVAARDEVRIAEANLAALAAADAATRERAAALVEASRARLRNWGVAERDFAMTPAGRTTVLLRAEHDGTLVEKPARVGMRFMPGDVLYQFADLGRVWLQASVYEQDIAAVHPGQPVVATLAAYPGRSFSGRIGFVSPVLNAQTRTVDVRIELPNPAGALKPAMYANVDLAAGEGAATLAVPDGAILDSGTRRLVLIDRGGGAFEPRSVRTGMHGSGFTEVLEGLAEGDRVVAEGNFLIDAESNLRAVVGAMASPRESKP